MDCKKIKNKIDELIYTKGMQLDMQEQSHLDECNDCRKYYSDTLNSAQLFHEIQQREPVLDNPEELSESIMKSIKYEEQEHSTVIINYRLISRVLTAAAVAMLLTLGIEQYMVLSKVQLLEAKLGEVQQTHQYEKYLINKATIIDIGMLFNNDNRDFSLKKASVLFRLSRIKKSNFTFYDFNRYMTEDDSLKSSINK